MTDFNSKIKKLHFVGIGGVSMCSLAEIMKKRGFFVSGSDQAEGEAVGALRAGGIPVAIGHAAENIAGAHMVIYTAAVKPDNPELVAARAAGIPVIERAPFMGKLLEAYKNRVGVCGTHGKTTTTSMLSLMFLEAKKDPTLLIGARLAAIGGNFRAGGSEWVVFEACEYVDSFLNFPTDLAVVLNIEADHLDYFKNIESIYASFSKYVSQAHTAVWNADNPGCLEVSRGYTGKSVYFSLGLPKSDYYAKIVSKTGYPVFELYENGAYACRIALKVPGAHNVQNALAAAAAARQCGIGFGDIGTALESFTGAHRRFEYIGGKNGFTVVDDYAHHPTEIRAALAAARSICGGRIFCIFQPHTYSRTAALFDDFAAELAACDKCLLVDIYSAREKNDPSVSSARLAKKTENAEYMQSLEAAAEYVLSHAREGDLVITMGAGDVYKTAHLIVSA